MTHIKVNSYDLSDDTFNEIDIYLPQLTHLSFDINYSITTDSDSDNDDHNEIITDSVLKPLSKLKLFKCLIINIITLPREEVRITDDGICHIINNCSELRSIRFSGRLDITQNI